MEGEQQHIQSETVTTQTQSPLTKKLPSILGWILSIFVFLAPIFVVPSVAIAIDASKTWILLGAVFLGTIVTILHLLLRGEVSLPRTLTVYAFFGVLISAVLSAFFSPQKIVAFLSSGSQIGTASTTGLLVLLGLLSAYAFREKKALFGLFLSFFGGFAILSLFHIIRLLAGADVLSFGVFQSAVFSLSGKWNDFAVVAGLALILATVSEFYFKPNVKILWASRAFALIAAVFVAMIDFWILWIVIAIVVGLFLVRTLVDTAQGSEGAPLSWKARASKMSILALVVVVLGFGFGYLFRFPVGDSTPVQAIVNKLSPQSYAEIVLPPGPTWNIASGVWKEGTTRALFGVGGNRFSAAYFNHKPDGINNTPLWDSSFDAGFSHVTTAFATNGIFGLLAWLLLIVSALSLVYSALKERSEGVRAYLAHSTALATLYLLVVLCVYLPNLSTTALFFVFLGALAGFLSAEGKVKTCSVALPNARGWGVAFVPLLVLVAIGVSVWSFEVTGALRAEAAYQEARSLANQGNTRDALALTEQASSIAPRDSQYRLVADLHLLEFQRVLAETPSSQEALQKKVQELAKNASDAASRAIQLDPTNYLNHVSRAGIGDLFATLNIDRTVTAAAARDAYIEASRLNPSSPRLEFAIGRASLLLGDRQGAILHLEKARELRPAYPEAIAALAELNRQDGKMDRAIEIATAGLQNDPSNFIILFQLGFLYYTNSDFDRAIAAFENAIAINPYYADAKYFLGVAYAEKGNREAAMKQFEEIRTLNPENPEIKRVIKNMTEGRKPLQDQ